MEQGGPLAANPAPSELSAGDLERIREALADAFAASTRRAYLSNWDAFRSWAEGERLVSAPASPETVAAHLARLANTVGPATLRIRRTAIGAVHRAAGLPDPASSELVKRTLAGLVRRAAYVPRQAAPLTSVSLAAVRATACLPREGGGRKRRRRETEADARRRGLADIALCSVMRDALLRRSEAAALTWADIASEGDGSGRLTIRRSKTDSVGVGAVQYLGHQAMADLVAIRPSDAHPTDSVFGISATQINRRIAAAARTANLEGSFSGHSPRVGMAQDLAARGAALPELMQAGRWSSSSMPARYTRFQAAGRGAVAKYYSSLKARR